MAAGTVAAGTRPAGGMPGDAVLPGEGILPVLPALCGLLAYGGLPRGHVITTDGWGLLCLALAAGASAAGAWCAAVGLPALGVRAAADAGLEHREGALAFLEIDAGQREHGFEGAESLAAALRNF